MIGGDPAATGVAASDSPTGAVVSMVMARGSAPGARDDRAEGPRPAPTMVTADAPPPGRPPPRRPAAGRGRPPGGVARRSSAPAPVRRPCTAHPAVMSRRRATQVDEPGDHEGGHHEGADEGDPRRDPGDQPDGGPGVAGEQQAPQRLAL